MKVNISDLKIHLSRYLKNLDEDEPIEVCLREEPIAYLVSAGSNSRRSGKALADKVRSAGLIPHATSREYSPKAHPVPGLAGDGRTDVSTVESMRRERDY